MISMVAIAITSCGKDHPESLSDTGIEKAHADIETGSDGLTAEQRNVKMRLEEDNKIGAIKHLYVISAMSGEVILYSTVDGKVTSGGKRLNPTTVVGTDGDYVGTSSMGMRTSINGVEKYTEEVMQDDGTYGSSMNYLYWWDVKGVYHQHYVTGGQIVHISAEAIPVTEITINLSPTESN